MLGFHCGALAPAFPRCFGFRCGGVSNAAAIVFSKLSGTFRGCWLAFFIRYLIGGERQCELRLAARIL